MANKTDGITELTKTLVSAAKKFRKKEYDRLTSVIFAMLHGVSYGYDQMDQRFLNDAADIYEVHQDHDEFLEEIDKAFNYFLSILVLTGFSADDLIDAYRKKDEIINSRLESGY